MGFFRPSGFLPTSPVFLAGSVLNATRFITVGGLGTVDGTHECLEGSSKLGLVGRFVAKGLGHYRQRV